MPMLWCLLVWSGDACLSDGLSVSKACGSCSSSNTHSSSSGGRDTMIGRDGSKVYSLSLSLSVPFSFP
uniref:Putative secreted protein n=1 Tax=Anopheles darlingi TaxID=43151 RepID=A0A2M4DKN4_ANODA